MNITAAFNDITQSETDCVMVGVYADKHLTPSAKAIDDASNHYLSSLLERGDFAGKLEQSLMLHDVQGVKAPRVLLVGLGENGNLNGREHKKVIDCALAAASKTQSQHITSCLFEMNATQDTDWQVMYHVTALAEKNYQFEHLKSDKKPAPSIHSMVLHTEDDNAGDFIARAHAIAIGMDFTKDLGNYPGNICTPTYLAEQAEQLGRDHPSSLNINVLEESDMEALNMGAFLSVSRGSAEPAKLIAIEYKAPNASNAPVALVGKGVTFDTGGTSIKPSLNMDERKYDMCGAATVMGVMKAIAEMKLPLNVIGFVGATENMPGSRATKPGDIVKTYSGQTVEVLNTDAEGRLVLCDVLSYAQSFNPSAVVNMATLTGAMVVALGHVLGGFFSNNEQLAEELTSASKDSFDGFWRLPMNEDYNQALQSNFADMANIGDRSAGSITAACFLQRFINKDMPWAHLDIAGIANLSGKQKAATGRPVPMVCQFLMNRAYAS